MKERRSSPSSFLKKRRKLLSNTFKNDRVPSHVSSIFHKDLIYSSHHQRIMNRLQVVSQALGKGEETVKKLIIERKDGKAIVWLNSLKDLNCLSIAMGKELNGALMELDEDPNVKVILIRSKHGKVFCAGADIKHMNQNDYSSYPHKLHFLSFERTFRHLRKPVVAVVEGKALGGGFQLALLADVILASKSAVFALPEITLGLIPGIGGTQNLTRIVGPKVAMKMILAGESINAQDAHRLKIAFLIPAQNFQAEVSSFADTLVNRAMQTLEGAKRAIRTSLESTLELGLQHESQISASLQTKKGPLQGVTAFLEKRKPDYRKI